MKKLIILCLVPTLSFAAGVDYPFENICDYDSNVVTTYKGEIEKYKVPSKKVFPYYKDTKQCLVTVQAKIKDKWYSTTANHVFTADMSENDACNRAINRAKENIQSITDLKFEIQRKMGKYLLLLGGLTVSG